MTIPALIIGVLLSSLYGVLFHLYKNGGLARLIYYLLLSMIGFWTGHFLGNLLSLDFLSIGPLFAGGASIGSILALIIGQWLSLVEVSSKKHK